MAEFVEKYFNPFTDVAPCPNDAHNPGEIQVREEKLKIYRDLKNSLDTAREEGWEKAGKKHLIWFCPL